MSIPGFPYPHSIVTTNGAGNGVQIPVATHEDDELVCAIQHPLGNGDIENVFDPGAFTVGEGFVTVAADTTGSKLTLIWVTKPVEGS